MRGAILSAILLSAIVLIGCSIEEEKLNVVDPAKTVNSVKPLASAEYVGRDTCSTCHSNVADTYMDTYHPFKSGTVETIHPKAIEDWGNVPDERGNPVVFDEDEPTGIKGTRDLKLSDGTELTGVDGVYIRNIDATTFMADFYNQAGDVIYSKEVTPYHVGAGKYRQAFSVNLGNGEGTRLMKYQYSLDDFKYQYEWRDRNQARIFEINCIGCHVTGFDLEKWEADKNQPLQAFTANLGIGCENCHGPGSLHVKTPSKDTIVNPSNLTKDQQVHNCGQCHIRGKSTNRPERQDNIDFRPGDNVLDNFKPVSVKWGEASDRVAADGKARASRQQFMDHYIGNKSSMTCTTCHGVHKFNQEGLLLKDELTALCTSCHDQKDQDIKKLLNGTRGWEEDEDFKGWRQQHTFRLDEEGRMIGITEEKRPTENKWPWEYSDWKWDF